MHITELLSLDNSDSVSNLSIPDYGPKDFRTIEEVYHGDRFYGGNSTLLSPGDRDTWLQIGNSTVPSSVINSINLTRQLAPLRYVALVLYLLTFFFGIIGNTLTIYVILRNKRMKTVATCFILNLAVADDFFMLSLPFMAYNTFTKNWIFGSLMCKLMSALYGVNLYASIFTMVLMSFDRYLAIVHPLRSIRYRTVKNAVVVCVLIWMACCIIMMPYWLYAQTGTSNNSLNKSTCQIYWPSGSSQQHRYFWANFELLIGFVFPIIIMVVCYLQLLRNMVINAIPAHQEPTRRPIRKVTIMIFIVTIVFVLCWTPYHIIRYTNAHRSHTYQSGNSKPSQYDIVSFAVFNVVAQALVFLASCCNPFIYGVSSRNFRE